MKVIASARDEAWLTLRTQRRLIEARAQEETLASKSFLQEMDPMEAFKVAQEDAARVALERQRNAFEE